MSLQLQATPLRIEWLETAGRIAALRVAARGAHLLTSPAAKVRHATRTQRRTSASAHQRRGPRVLRGLRQTPLRDMHDVVNQSEFSEPDDDQAVEVELVPRMRNVGVAWKTMMVVMKPFAEGEDRRHELVGGSVVDVEAAVAVVVADRSGQRTDENQDVGPEQSGKQHAS